MAVSGLKTGWIMNNYYVYILRHPTTSTVFYVGKGKGRRCNLHIWYAKTYKKNPKGYNCIHLHRKIRKMLSIGISPSVEKIYERLSEEESLIKEKELIKFYGRENLCNLTDGGEGISGFKHSAETKRKITKSLIGREMSEKTRLALAKANLGRKMSNESIRKSVFARQNKTYTVINHVNNSKFVTRNLADFCREMGLKSSTLRQSYEKTRKTLSGPNASWEMVSIEKEDLTKG